MEPVSHRGQKRIIRRYANFVGATGSESSFSTAQPIPLLSLAYQPRMLQFGFRTTF
jgi:hypothetical protein